MSSETGAAAATENDASYRLMFEQNPQPMWVFETETLRFLAVNDAAVKHYGYSREEFLTLTLRDIRSPEDLATLEDNLERSKMQGDYHTTVRHRKKDGTAIWVQVSAHDIPFEGRRARLVLASDITEIIRAQEALRESEARFRALAETAASAIFIYQGPKFRYVNKSAEEITGYTREELLAGNFWDVVHPDHREMIMQRGLARQRGEFVSPRYEFKLLRKNGEEAWVDFTAGVIELEGGVAALGTAFDITDRKQATEALLKSERRFRALVERSSDGIALIDQRGRILWAGPSTQRILGYPESRMVRARSVDFVHPDDRRHVARLFAHVLGSPGISHSDECRARHADGSWRWVEVTASNLVDEPSVGAVVVNYRDVTERKEAEDQIRHQALHDALTGLPNRALFHDRLTLALAHARRTSRVLAVMFLDLDSFKMINDTLGHTLGDRLLQAVANRLRETLRSTDMIARLGGDEFTLVLEETTPDDAASLASKVLDQFTTPFMIDEHQLFITASIGISLYPNDGVDAETLTKNADNAMYRAKELGRNNVQLFTASLNERYRNRLMMEKGLRLAIDHDELALYYQTIHRCDDGDVVGAEALLRWNHPDRGLVRPDHFVPLAEDTRLILPIGAWALRSACEQITRWNRERGTDYRVAVNLSVRQFQQLDLVDMVEQILAETGTDPRWLELEITESVAMQNADWTWALLHELRRRGISIAIDDFGAGQSSLIYLRKFPISRIKIDQLFIQDMTTNEADAAIVSAVIQLTHDLGLSITAEGVETEEQWRFLQERGCDYVQGYFFTHPVPADAVQLG